MGGISIWQILILLIILPLAFLPSIIAIRKDHPYKIPIVLVNLFGSVLWGAGWLIALVWCFILPKQYSSKAGAASEIEKLHELKEKGIITQDEFEKKKKALL
jgi:hypothetical protein